jgi:hypothetical protein
VSEKLFAVIAFVAIGAFALLFKDAFMATSEFLDDARCTIGMKHYCDKE